MQNGEWGIAKGSGEATEEDEGTEKRRKVKKSKQRKL